LIGADLVVEAAARRGLTVCRRRTGRNRRAIRTIRLGRVRLDAILVKRMDGDAVFGDAMHLLGTDLQFDALASRPDYRRMDRAIVILLRRRNIILEAARHGRPGRVDDAERRVAFAKRIDDHAEAIDVGELLEAHRLPLHLAEDRIGPLLASP